MEIRGKKGHVFDLYAGNFGNWVGIGVERHLQASLIPSAVIG